MAPSTFSCHMQGAEKPAICAGFLLKGSTHNLAFRLQSAKGLIDLREVHDGGAELYENYREMAEANGVDRKDKSLEDCRC